DCRRLMLYCDAMNIFAGHFSLMVSRFEEDFNYWVKLGHGDAALPYRFPIDATMGSLKVPTDRIHSPKYFATNEATFRTVPWKPAPKLKKPPVRSTSPVQPENYFDKQMASGIRWMRENNFCRWGTHCTDAPHPGGSVGKGSDRLYGMWGTT